MSDEDTMGGELGRVYGTTHWAAPAKLKQYSFRFNGYGVVSKDPTFPFP